MPVESEADRAIFVEASEFGASVVWTSESGASPVFSAIFDNDYLLLTSDQSDGGGEGSAPVIECRTSDMPADADHDDTLAITRLDDAGDSIAIGSFKVVEIMPDGTGMTKVRLQEV